MERVVLLLCTVLLFGCAGNKKSPDAVQERRMTDRLLNPDRSQASRYNRKEFTGSQLFGSRKYQAGTYRGSKEAYSKTFSSGREYAGSSASPLAKPARMSNETFNARSAAFANNAYTAGSYETSSYAQSDKHTQVRPGVVLTPETKVEGSAQGRLDDISKEVEGKLTIDEIRDLLNKSR